MPKILPITPVKIAPNLYEIPLPTTAPAKLYLSQTSTRELLTAVLAKHHITSPVLRTAASKPYLKSGEFHFSLSDSGGYSICALSSREIGADIQKITYKRRIVAHDFTEAEKTTDPLEFTRIWTLKEAHLKKLGTGLAYGLKNVDTAKLPHAQTLKFRDYLISIVF